MNNLNKKKVAQEQSQCTVIISITNIDKFNTLLSEITEKLKELKSFKLEVETQLDIDKVADELAERLRRQSCLL